MLDDAATVRYSRQILLPEVGGRGQERLGAARVAVVGGGPVATIAADLLRRAGVGDVTTDGAVADVVVDVGGTGRRAGARVVVTVGGTGGIVATAPTGTIVPATPAPTCGHPALAAPAALALGALAAAEALLVVLGRRSDPRRHTLDVGGGTLPVETCAGAAG